MNPPASGQEAKLVSVLGRKQTANNQIVQAVWEGIERYVSRQWVDHLAARAIGDIKATCDGQRCAYAWSGGKDSLALAWLCEAAGIPDCVFGMNDLEYPEFLRWATENMPKGLTVVNTGQNLDWLCEHPDMLFPQDADTAGKWFRLIQHKAQADYFYKQRLDVLLLGRRRQDGNYVGPKGCNIYTSSGVVRYSPIAHWRHEDVLALLHYYAIRLPPCYAWPNGWVVGTGCWPARQHTGTIEQGWREVYSIDPTIVRRAARRIASAAAFLSLGPPA